MWWRRRRENLLGKSKAHKHQQQLKWRLSCSDVFSRWLLLLCWLEDRVGSSTLFLSSRMKVENFLWYFVIVVLPPHCSFPTLHIQVSSSSSTLRQVLNLKSFSNVSSHRRFFQPCNNPNRHTWIFHFSFLTVLFLRLCSCCLHLISLAAGPWRLRNYIWILIKPWASSQPTKQFYSPFSQI